MIDQMIWSVFFLMVKIFAFFVFVIVATATYHHFRAKSQMARYINQGIY